MTVLDLEVLDYRNPAHWRWRLSEPGGAFVADHDVRLETSASEFEAFVDLSGYLRWNASPDRRLASESELVERVGRWIGEHVLGPIGPALLARRPVTVRIALPAEAAELGERPLELAFVGDRPLALQDVSLVVERAGTSQAPKAPIRDRLRMLAVFSLPVDASALALRHERYSLARLVHEVAARSQTAVELRVLQYGVTRDRLDDVLLEDEGWDVIHVSAHGLPSGLLLEREDGSADLVSSDELVRLFGPVRSQLKLVTLSSCESAATIATESLRLLGLGTGTNHEAEDGQAALPALAAGLSAQLGCAVLAMRYPVADDFAIALSQELYELLLGKGQPLARALQLALPRALPDQATPGAPPLSVATPALFGAAAVDLRLAPPRGEPTVFDAERTKLAYFPGQPRRFVGRVGPMARASSALAPRSGRSGVLFHGMAGAGKTACALELAYGHERTFDRLVWHAAPQEGDDIAGAVTALALDFEQQLPGLKLAHLVSDANTLRGALPRLAQVLEEQNVLLVLDNIEGLLTEDGRWRDERWSILVETLLGHDGLSRTILTSRRVPEGLDEARTLVEPIHALSLQEAVLLARELPNLGALLEGRAGLDVDMGRRLVARTLELVQGHPKLLELADGEARNPTALEERLTEADEAWSSRSERLETFLRTGEAAATSDDYLRVLDAWTRSAASALPEASTLAFQYLCALEPNDRNSFIAEANWGDLWRRLQRPGEPPHLEAALAPVVAQALVEPEPGGDEEPTRYQIHPGVAEAGRAGAGHALQAAVDAELATWWNTIAMRMVEDEHEESVGTVVIGASQSALPYLVRLDEWSLAIALLEQVLVRDSSPATIATLLPLARRMAAGAADTDVEGSRFVLAKMLHYTDPTEAERELRALASEAVAREDFASASVFASEVFSVLRARGQLDEALTWIDSVREYRRRAGFGPWSQLADEGRRLTILNLQGQNAYVLDAVEELRKRMETLPEQSDEPESIHPWNVRESILDLGRSAALDLGRWERALEFGADVQASKARRGVTQLEQVSALFNDQGPLLRLGRYDEARQLLLYCRAVFERESDLGGLARVLSALADLADELDQAADAVRFGEDALRLAYARADARSCGINHFNLAVYMRKVGLPAVGLAHRLAASVLDFQAGFELESDLRALRADLAGFGNEPPLPASFTELCGEVEEVEGVRFSALFEQLPRRLPDGDAVLAHLVELVGALPAAPPAAVAQALDAFEPLMEAVVTAAASDRESIDELEDTLAELGETDDWARLAVVFRRVLAGERGEGVLEGLDPIDTAIATETLRRLAVQEAS